MDESLESLYFDWLYAKIHLTDIPYNSYSSLLNQLNRTEFIWLLSGDDNRAEDGIDLRKEFIIESGLDVDESWFDDGCSVLEMLVALSRHAAFETGESRNQWFWEFLTNLNLTQFHDDEYDPEAIAAILYIFVWRTYEHDGSGGMFPLDETPDDQRTKELWYQFCEYLAEKEVA